jgi:hypothetical protein
MRLQWDGRQGRREKKLPNPVQTPTVPDRRELKKGLRVFYSESESAYAPPLPIGQANWPELGRRTTHATGRVQGCYSHAERRESAT